MIQCKTARLVSVIEIEFYKQTYKTEKTYKHNTIEISYE